MQAVVGATVTVCGVVILATIDPGWNWLGALGAGLGPAIFLLGVTDLLNKGDNGVRRVARLLRVVRLTGWFLTITLVVLDLFLSLLAVGLLAVAVFQGQWSQSVESLLASAALVAGMALGVALMVRVAELPVAPLARISWWRELANLQQLTHVAIAVTLVGTAVAFGLRDAGGAVIAMVGLATVLLGWGRADRIATDEGIRRLAEAADAVSAALRPLVTNPPAERDAACEAIHDAAISALAALELACFRHMRRGLAPAAPRYLVDIELLAVIRACKVALTSEPFEHVSAPLTAAAARMLSSMQRPQLEREVLVFVADLRRLATLAPDRLGAS